MNPSRVYYDCELHTSNCELPTLAFQSSLRPGQQVLFRNPKVSRAGITAEKPAVLAPLLSARTNRALGYQDCPQLSSGVWWRRFGAPRLVEKQCRATRGESDGYVPAKGFWAIGIGVQRSRIPEATSSETAA